ncbi:hypothetical protein H311_04618, partial [Anncaliia algerae PRA109]
VYAEHQNIEKLEKISKIHQELAYVRRDALIHNIKDKIYLNKKEEVEYIQENCVLGLFRRIFITRQIFRQIIDNKVAERYQADLVDLRFCIKANDDCSLRF